MSALRKAARCTTHPGGRLVIAPEWAGKIAALVCGSSCYDGRNWGTYAKGSGQTFTPGKRGPALRTNSDSEAGIITFANPPNRIKWGFVFVGREFSSSFDGAWNVGDTTGYVFMATSSGLSIAAVGIENHYVVAQDFTPRFGAVAGYFNQSRNRGAVYRDGALYGSGSHDPSAATLPYMQCGSRHQGESTRSWRGEQELLVILNGSAREEDAKLLSANPWQIFVAQQRTFFDLLAGGASGQIGIVAETDSALAITASKTLSVGLNAETDTPLALTAQKTSAVDLSTSDESALAITALKTAIIAQAIETDASLGLGTGQSAVIGQASEIDEALAISASKTQSTGINAESATALPVAAAKATAIGLNAETEFALPVAAVKTAYVGQAQETDTAIALGTSQTVAIGTAAEDNFAQAVAKYKAIGILQAASTDTALPVTPNKVYAIGLAVETEAVFGVAATRTVSIGIATEQDSALALAGAAPPSWSLLTTRRITVPASLRSITVPAHARRITVPA